MIFRLAEMSDLEMVQTCILAAFAPYEKILGVRPKALDVDFRSLIQSGEIFVLVNQPQDSVVGVMRLLVEQDKLLLANMAVMPASQGRGVGRKLIEFAQLHAAKLGLAEIELHTNAKLTHLLEFYAKQGFVETGRQHQVDRTLVYFKKSVAD